KRKKKMDNDNKEDNPNPAMRAAAEEFVDALVDSINYENNDERMFEKLDQLMAHASPEGKVLCAVDPCSVSPDQWGVVSLTGDVPTAIAAGRPSDHNWFNAAGGKRYPRESRSELASISWPEPSTNPVVREISFDNGVTWHGAKA